MRRSRNKNGAVLMPQPTKAIISNEQKSGIRKGSNRASTGKVGALLLTTSLNMRKREFAVLRSVGMTVNKLFAMLCIENLRNGLLAILIGGISSLPLCYLIYKSIVVGAVIDFVFPLGAFVISSLAMFLIMFLTSLYGLWKIKNGDIIADVRNDFV